MGRHRKCSLIAGDDEGQMVVEMAVIAPVMIVIALVVLNLMWFLEAASRFDRVSLDAVLALAVSVAGESGDAGADHEVKMAIEKAMEGLRGVTVTVSSRTGWEEMFSGVGFTLAPHLTTYTCTMRYTPWPRGFSIAGIDAGIPFEVTHTRSITVDRYRSGVLF